MSAPPVDLRMKQRGVALITILLIVAVLTAIVSRVGLTNQLWLRQTENSNALAQAELASRAAQLWIADILVQDKNSFDAVTDLWAQPLPPVPAGWGYLFGRIEDMQARFNLNNLVDGEGAHDSQAMQQFERLLQLLDLNPGIAQAVADWIDVDGSPAGPWGAEDVYYISLEMPYLAANRPFEDTAELRMVRGIDLAVWQKLEPYVSALPGKVAVNVNTASAEVLAAVVTEWEISGQALSQAQLWTGSAALQPIDDIRFFAQRMLGGSDKPLPPGLDIGTGYFMAYTQLNFDNVEYRMASLYRREQGEVALLRHNRVLL